MPFQGNRFGVETQSFRFLVYRTSFSGEPPFLYAQSGYKRTSFSGSTVMHGHMLYAIWTYYTFLFVVTSCRIADVHGHTILYYSIQYCTILYYTILYCTILCTYLLFNTYDIYMIYIYIYRHWAIYIYIYMHTHTLTHARTQHYTTHSRSVQILI